MYAYMLMYDKLEDNSDLPGCILETMKKASIPEGARITGATCVKPAKGESLTVYVQLTSGEVLEEKLEIIEEADANGKS